MVKSSHRFRLLLGQDFCLLQDPHAEATLEAIHVHHPGRDAGLLRASHGEAGETSFYGMFGRHTGS